MIVREKSVSLSGTIVNAYLVVLSIFYLISFIGNRRYLSREKMAVIVAVTLCILVIVAIIVGRKKAKVLLMSVKDFIQERDAFTTGMLLVLFVSMIVSILCVAPNDADTTLNNVIRNVTQMESFYAVLATLLHIDAGVFAYYVAPVFLLPFYFFSYWEIGKVFAGTEKEKLTWFELVVCFIYWMSVITENQAVFMGVFQNCWNGYTLLMSNLLPLLVAACIQLLKETDSTSEEKEGKWKVSIWNLIRIVAIVIVAGFMHVRGSFYSVLVIALTIFIFLMRKGYRYGITLRNH